MLKNNKNRYKAFTIVEVMISLAILALISGATVLVAQPNIIKDQVNDQRRVNELDDISEAITYLNTWGSGLMNLGDANTVYTSLVDNTSTTCASYALPSLPSGYSYACKREIDYRKNDGNGWIPITFKEPDNSSVLVSLPIDPVNNGNYYYTYFPGNNFELTAQLTKAREASLNDNGLSPTLYETGEEDRLVTPVLRDSGLLSYFSFDNHDTDEVVYDHSGSGNGGSWNGTGDRYDPIGPLKKVAVLNGENDSLDIINLNKNFSIFTISLWIKIDTITPGETIVGKWAEGSKSLLLRTNPTDGKTIQLVVSKNGSVGEGDISEIETGELVDDTWYYVTVIYKGKTDGHTIAWMYVNGEQVSYKSDMVFPIYETDLPVSIGYEDETAFPGKVDEFRFYDRLLNAKEIKSIYEKTRNNYK